MENIPPIEDAYIDSIIKSAGAYQPSLIKTQGVKLRELLKLFRDRFEQEITTIHQDEQHLTFGNGLKQEGDKVELGGDYTGEIRIGGTADNPVFLMGNNGSGSTYTSLNINGSDYAAGVQSSRYQDKLSSSLFLLKNLIEASLKIEDNGDFKMLVTDQIANRGLEEAGDYSANKTQYSYITKKMLDLAISSLSAVAISGKYSDLSGKPVNLTEFSNDLGNYGNFAKNDGSNVAGTWNLNISGNATTAGNANKWGGLDGQYLLTGGIQSDGLSALTGVHGNGYAYQFNSAAIKNFLSLGSFAYKNSINGSEILSGYNQPPSTDIGTAQTLRWKNYGNGHVIFDASQGTSPSGTQINNANPEFNWDSTYPTLMGWNGINTYGVRVDSSRQADIANVWNAAGSYVSSDVAVNTYLMAYGPDGNWHPSSVANIRNFLGLASGAYNDKTQLWSVSHPNNYYISNTWDGTYWQLTSNHSSPINVGHSDNAEVARLWGGRPANFDTVVSSVLRLTAVDSSDGAVRQVDVTAVQSWLGLGSIAYENSQLYHRYGGFTADANTVSEHTSAFTYQLNAPATGTLMHFGAQGYGTQFNTSYGGNDLFFRTRNGDIGAWNAWRTVWHSGTLNPQVSSVASSVVQRDVNGYVEANFFKSAVSAMNPTDGTPISLYGNLGTDGYHYSQTALSVRRFLGSPDAGENFDSVTARYATASRQIKTYGYINLDQGYKSTNYRGMYGDYDENGSTDKIIWTIGSAWNELNSMYGMNYSYSGKYGGGHQIQFRSAGSPHAAIDVDYGNAFFDGSVNAGGGFYDTSDVRLKTLTTQQFDTRSVKAYTYYKNEKLQTGYLAQDLEDVLPHAVSSNGEYLTLNYNQVLVNKVSNLEDDLAVSNQEIHHLKLQLEKVLTHLNLN